MHFPVTHGGPLLINFFEAELSLFWYAIQKDLTGQVEFNSITLTTERTAH